MLENATRVCGANFGTMSLYEAGNLPQRRALQCTRRVRGQQLLVPFPSAPEKWSCHGCEDPSGRSRSKIFGHSRPIWKAIPPSSRLSDLAGARTIVIVPMLKENELIGAITIYPSGSPAVYRQADRSGRQLRQAGGDRHREHPAAQGIARTHRRLERIAAAANRHRRRAQGDQPLGVRSADGARNAGRVGGPTYAKPTQRALSSSEGDGILLARVQFYALMTNASRFPAEQSCSQLGEATAQGACCLTRRRRAHCRRAGSDPEFTFAKRQDSAVIGPCSVCRCCATARRSA